MNVRTAALLAIDVTSCISSLISYMFYLLNLVRRARVPTLERSRSCLYKQLFSIYTRPYSFSYGHSFTPTCTYSL